MSAREGKVKDSAAGDDRPLTEGKFKYYFESIKDLIASSSSAVKKDVGALKQDVAELKGDVAGLKKDVTELKQDMTELKQDMTELKGDVGMVKVAVSEHTRLIKGLDVKIDDVRKELKEEMHQMEGRLTERIDGHASRLDDHEARISALEVR